MLDTTFFVLDILLIPGGSYNLLLGIPFFIQTVATFNYREATGPDGEAAITTINLNFNDVVVKASVLGPNKGKLRV